MHNPKKNLIHAVLWMTISCILFSLMAVIIKHLSQTVPPFEVVLLRNIFGTIILLPWMLKYKLSIITTRQLKLYTYRTLTGLFGMISFFYSLSILPTNEVVPLTFTVPLITALFATILLKEKIDLSCWIALICGFAGVLIILRPDFKNLNIAMLLVLLTSCAWAISSILNKKMVVYDSPIKIMVILALIMTPMSIPLLLLGYKPLSTEEITWVFILAVISTSAQYTLILALSKSDIGTLMPIDFSRLIFVSIISYLWLGEILDIFTVIGAIIIFLSALYTVRHQRKKIKTSLA